MEEIDLAIVDGQLFFLVERSEYNNQGCLVFKMQFKQLFDLQRSIISL
jgi:hypothetical protein